METKLKKSKSNSKENVLKCGEIPKATQEMAWPQKTELYFNLDHIKLKIPS